MAMKQNNFYLRWQKAAGAAKTESRSKDLRAVVPGIAVVAVCMAGWGVMVLHTSMLKSRRQNILNWCADNSATYLSSTLDAEEAAEFRSLTDYATGMTNLLNSYPDVTSTLLHRIEAAGGASITIQFTSYNARQNFTVCRVDVRLYRAVCAVFADPWHREPPAGRC